MPDAADPHRQRRYGRALDAMYQRSAIFRRVLEDPAILDPLKAILGPNIEVVLNRHNHATMNFTDQIPVRLHRDVMTWSRPIVTVIVYVDDAPAERGATLVVPASHLLPFFGPPGDGGGGTWADEFDEYAHLANFAVPVPMVGGEALIFNSLLFHSVGHNASPHPRTSVSFALCAVDELLQAGDPKRVLLVGERCYHGNDLDYGDVIPAHKSQRADHQGPSSM